MTDKPKDLLKLSWDELNALPWFVEAVQGVLNPGPWEHVPRERSRRTTEERCCRCDARRGVRLGFAYEMKGCTQWMSELTREYVTKCPVPPPITDPPEMVADRLLKIVLQTTDYGYIRTAISDLFPAVSHNWANYFAWWLKATPTQRILTCMKALGKIEE